MSTIEVNKIAPVSGGTTVQVGESGNTINIPSGATITNSGTANNFTSYRPNAKPLIINGDMQVAQRSTSVSTTAGGYKTVDRLQFNTSSTTGNATFTQENDAPSNTGFRKSMKITPNATETMSGSKNILFTYALEGQDVQVLQHGSASPPKATLSFWVKSNKTGAYSVQVKEETIANESYVLFEYTISQADTWEQKVFSWTGNSAHTLNNDNTMGFRLCWHLASGSDDHASATTSWVVESTYKTTANQVNFFDSTSNTWYITGIQLEVGEYTSSTLPPFQHESYADNLLRCLRYFQAPIFTSSQGVAEEYSVFGTGVYSSNSYFRCPRPLPVEMRVNPSLISSSGTNYFFILSGANDDINDLTLFPDSNFKTAWVYNNDEASGTAGQAGILMGNNASAYAWLNAEL